MKRFLLLALALTLSTFTTQAQKKPLTFTDVMQFKAIEDPVLSDDGKWLSFTAQPDRGDGEVVVRSTESNERYTISLGSDPVFSHDAGWVGATLNPSMQAVHEAGDDDKPKNGMALLETATGTQDRLDNIESFAFSAEGPWIAILHAVENEKDSDAAKKEGKQKTGSTLEIRQLNTANRTTIEHVQTYAFDEAGETLVYSIAASDSSFDGLFARSLDASLFNDEVMEIDRGPKKRYSALSWSEADNLLAFVASVEKEDEASLHIWDGSSLSTVGATENRSDGWSVASNNELQWSKDGERLFFGLKPQMENLDTADADSTFDPYDEADLLDDREVDVWHWNDPLINSHQKKQWETEKKRTYSAVYHRDSGESVALANRLIRDVVIPENPNRMLARAPGPYSKDRTWDGTYFDLYTIDLEQGGTAKLAERLQHTTSLSPDGQFAVYYRDPHWHLVDLKAGEEVNLTESLNVPFANEDNDYPQAAPGYGVAGWLQGDEAVLLYDKYDLWSFPTDRSKPVKLTGGRDEEMTFRIVKTDPDQEALDPDQEVLLSSYHNKAKTYGFYTTSLTKGKPTKRIAEDKRFRFVQKAKNADVYLYTRESYNEFPDLWVSNPHFKNPKKITDVNPQMAEFAWGTSELIEWRSTDGIPLQGVVIKPDNYDPDKRYPVLVYFYRFFSQRLHEFNQPRVNHRPAFPLYVSNDYVIFLPDVRFEVGRPGFSATKCIVPGVQKLVDMGIADPDALGLHGHSWSGYQTAFMVTQTDMFAAAVTGAPVSNMTSAYSGIRWQTGLARQFQYERSQSRLGGSLWEARDHYIDNSPVFFADQIETPLLIMHGDDDGAVPWYQSIELYLALRRLEKDAIFLQYRGEPHHLRKYPNKLDYAIKMKEYFDHYLKGQPAADWIVKGVPYRGD